MIFTDIPDSLMWAIPEIENAYRLGLVHGTGPDSLFGPKPDGWSDELWDVARLQKATTICLVIRSVQPWRPVVRMRQPSIYRITGAGIATAWSAGRMNSGPVLCTCAHAVLDDQGRPTAGFAQRIADIRANITDSRAFNVLHVSKTADLALISDPWAPEPIPLGDTPQEGDWLVGIGCGAGVPGRPMPFMSGVSGLGTVNSVKQQLMADSAVVQEGDSGGPVLDMSARVVGMISNTMPGGAMTNVIPLNVIRDIFSALNVAFSL